MMQASWDFSARKYEDEFEKWWDTCPKKVGKPRAATLWRQLKNKEPEKTAQVIAFTQSYAQSTRSMGIEDKYILHPATILSQRRWEDPKPEEKKECPAQKEWRAVIEYLRRYGRDSDQPIPLSENGKKALAAAGGRWKIGSSTEWTNEHKNKKIFLEAYFV